MNFNDGLDKALLEHDAPIVTDYEFFTLGRKLFEAKEWAGEPNGRCRLSLWRLACGSVHAEWVG
jgi:hypothetical protein